MSLRFFRRVCIVPGMRMNLSKSGVSLSVGRLVIRPGGPTSLVSITNGAHVAFRRALGKEPWFGVGFFCASLSRGSPLRSPVVRTRATAAITARLTTAAATMAAMAAVTVSAMAADTATAPAFMEVASIAAASIAAPVTIAAATATGRTAAGIAAAGFMAEALGDLRPIEAAGVEFTNGISRA
jgi:hypothetical protein